MVKVASMHHAMVLATFLHRWNADETFPLGLVMWRAGAEPGWPSDSPGNACGRHAVAVEQEPAESVSQYAFSSPGLPRASKNT